MSGLLTWELPRRQLEGGVAAWSQLAHSLLDCGHNLVLKNSKGMC